MSELLKGKPVADKMNEGSIADVEALKAKGVNPTLCIIRVGDNESDMAYERGALKKCEALNVNSITKHMPADVSQEEMLKLIGEINNDSSIHGVLLLRPLPKTLNASEIENALDPAKDVDCMTEASAGSVYTGSNIGYPPCTPTACMEILKFYGYDLKGKNVVVIGRSLVVGKPVAMMCMKENATITICHTKTKDMASVAKQADIIIVAAGHRDTVTKDFVNEKSVVIDVGINVNDEGKMCGDVAFDEVSEIVSAITPVPGGVGSVTTSVLLRHVVDAAKKVCQ